MESCRKHYHSVIHFVNEYWEDYVSDTVSNETVNKWRNKYDLYTVRQRCSKIWRPVNVSGISRCTKNQLMI